MLPRVNTYYLSLLAAALLQACMAANKGSKVAAATAPTRGKLTLNDVSILFPAPKDGSASAVSNYIHAGDLPSPQVVANGLHSAPPDSPPQPFLPKAMVTAFEYDLAADHDRRDQENYRDSGFDSESPDVFTNEYHAIAMRIDPCANILTAAGDDSKCQRQLRVLWQGTGPAALDLNIHTIYSITADELQDIVNRLLLLQQSSGLTYREYVNARLGPNPIIASQGMKGAYYRGAIAIIHSYARASRLVAVAGLGNSAPEDENTDFHWPMLLTTIDDGKLSPSAIPQSEADSQGQPYNVQRMPGDASANNNSGGLTPPQPAGKAKDALYPAKATKAVTAHIPRIEDPRSNDATTLDCASCHRGLIERGVANGTQIFINTETFSSDHWNLGNITDLTAMPKTALQMFSYTGKLSDLATPIPVISQRTINESAIVADYINQHYIK